MLLQPKTGDRVLLECTVQEVLGMRIHVGGYIFPTSDVREILRPVFQVNDIVVYRDQAAKIIHLYDDNTKAVITRQSGHPIFIDDVEKLLKCVA